MPNSEMTMSGKSRASRPEAPPDVGLVHAHVLFIERQALRAEHVRQQRSALFAQRSEQEGKQRHQTSDRPWADVLDGTR